MSHQLEEQAMKRAILLPYLCYQNEPSKPYPKIVELPDDVVTRDAFLKEFYLEHVSNNEDDPDFRDTLVISDESSYGDLEVTTTFGDVFLFVTYLEE